MIDWSRKTKPAPRWEPYRLIGTIGDHDVPQVSPDLPAVDVAERLLVRARTEALVVNGDGKPLGVVTSKQASGSTGTAGSLMTPISVVLHESVPLSVAASLMAGRDINHVAVVGERGRAVALLSWQAVLAILAISTPALPEVP